jgi:flavin-dependent dehydrogenase
MYDVIVVGARCAGSPTAMLLARRGYRVLLLDRSAFPSDIMSTHFIHVPGVVRLRNWGLLEKVWAAGTPPIENVTVYLEGQPLSPPRLPGSETLPPACCPRRTVLDKILVDAAVEAGAELREQFSVRELVWDDGQIVGVRGATKSGGVVEERARLVVGADGLHSLVARQVKPQEYDAVPSLTFAYYAYWSGVEIEGAELHPLDDGGVLVFPTNDGNTCVATGGPIDGFFDFRRDIEGNFFKMLGRTANLAERIGAGKRVERFMGTNDQPNYFRRPYGPGWALVGDAGYHRDFITGLGINDAFRDAELLSEAIDGGFSGGRPLDEAMAAYERRRDELAKPMYDVTLSMARGEGDLNIFLQLGLAIQANLPSVTDAAA